MKTFLSIPLLLCSVLLLTACGGGSGSSSAATEPLPETSSPTARPGLLINDIEAIYDTGLELRPIINQVLGEVSLQLATGSVTDVVAVSRDGRSLLVLNPGTAQVEATDKASGFQTATKVFTVTVLPAANTALAADRLTVALASDQQAVTYPTLAVRGKRGTLTFEVAEGYRHLLAIDASTGQLTPLGTPGLAYVNVTDSGNRRYAGTTIQVAVDIRPAPAEALSYANLKLPFAAGKTLLPQRLSGDDQASYHFAINPHGEAGVIQINADSGEILLLKPGYTGVDVVAEYGETFGKVRQTATFSVEVTLGERQPLQVDKLTTTFAAGRLLQPLVRNNKAQPVYKVTAGNAVAIDSLTGLPVIQRAGSSTLKASDYKDRRFPASDVTFQIEVAKAEHPGLQADALQLSYGADRQVTADVSGQLGTLSLHSSDNTVAQVKDAQLLLRGAGLTTIKVSDDGGANHLPAEVEFELQVTPGTAPALEYQTIRATYAADSCVDLSAYISAAGGALQFVDSQNPAVVDYDATEQCLRLLAAGTTSIRVRSAASANYLASEPVMVAVVVRAADSRLSVTDTVTAVYQADAVLPAPAVSGALGELSYALAADAAQDVVQLDPASGAMQILKAGRTRVLVSDQGDAGVQPGQTSFDVVIEPGVNSASVRYPSVSYQAGLSIVPQLDGPADMEYRFRLVSGEQVVNLVDATSGSLTVKAAGSYQLEVTAAGHNYQLRSWLVSGTVTRAAHPGFRQTRFELDYQPRQPVTLPLPDAHGERQLVLLTGQTLGLVQVLADGRLLLTGYGPYEVQLVVQESGDALYQPLESQLLTVSVNAPAAGSADQDIALHKTLTIIDSRLNKADFGELKHTQVEVVGAAGYPQSSDDDLRTFGEGQKLLVYMVRDSDQQRQPVLLYISRHDGCVRDNYNLTTLANSKAIAMDADGYCVFGTTGRYLLVYVTDDSHLDTGHWQLETPLSVLRRGERYFLPTTLGGLYIQDPSNTSASNATGPARRIYEWQRLELQMDID